MRLSENIAFENWLASVPNPLSEMHAFRDFQVGSIFPASWVCLMEKGGAVEESS